MIAAAADIAAGAAACAGNRGADAGQQSDDHAVCAVASCSLRRCRWPPARCPVSCAKHADNFVRRLGIEQRARVNEDVAAVHDEGVERAVAENDDAHVLLGQSGGAQDRLGIIAQELFDFGIANHRHAARDAVLGARRCKRGSAARGRHGDRSQQCDRPGCWRHAPRPDRCAVQGHPDFLPDWA